MNTAGTPVARVAVFVALLVGAFVPYGYLYELATLVSPTPHSTASFLLMLFVQALIPSVLIAALVAYPLAWLFRRAAPLAAVLFTLPVVVVLIMDAWPQAMLLKVSLTWFQAALYMALVIGATVWARRRYAL